MPLIAKAPPDKGRRFRAEGFGPSPWDPVRAEVTQLGPAQPSTYRPPIRASVWGLRSPGSTCTSDGSPRRSRAQGRAPAKPLAWPTSGPPTHSPSPFTPLPPPWNCGSY